MTRKKVKLAYITNDSARKATFKKRKKGLMKKVSELSTLCGIDACAIMYSPYESQPEVWPSPMGVHRVLSKFRKIPEMEQSKKMVNQETFLGQRITKASEQLKKQCKDNREKEMTHVMFQNLIGKSGLHGLNMMDLNDLGWLIDQNLKEIDKRVDLLCKTSHNPQGSSSSSSVATTPSVMTTVMPEATPRMSVGETVQSEVNNNVDSMQRQHWIMELMNNNNNPRSHVGFGGDEMMLPFGDNININNNPLWSNAFFPWEK
ncbi:Agamous-like MADS-box protein AGL80 [Hibiscus syriacus]|uniref:Agamous-like MADS-box protein AGL80 n=1 Tax=Hibiscus syriacus TaxID=106335 RepID=A0A6A2Z6H1_HIBSY|nr:agamous-like MADS-box protein AGL80 [Hibiscus syriacus]KAE8687277.1 Agamous-like MADS-box protein AGL80 [Hibiscus syriacus]